MVGGTINNRSRIYCSQCGGQGLLWLKGLLGEHSGNSSVVPTLHVDNASTVKLAKNPESHKQSKHNEVRHYFVRVIRMVA
jgi:hypothetical protein